MVELSIIVINWNGGEMLQQCLSCVAANPPAASFEVIVVDNASHDASVAWLRSATARAMFNGSPLQVIENDENRGFAKANNQAIEVSEAPYVLLLNSDADVTAGAIDSLMSTLQSNPRIGACGPRLLNTDGTLQHSVWRNPPQAWEILLAGSGLWRLIPRRVRGTLLLGGHWDHNLRRDVRMLFGAAILARREMIDQVGALDERFHMYAEDTEWCLRIVRAGWRLVFEPKAVVYHHGGQSSLKRWTNLEKLRVQLEASYFFQKHSLTRGQLISNELASYLTASAQLAWRRLRRIDAPDIKLARQFHREHLKRALWEKPI